MIFIFHCKVHKLRLCFKQYVRKMSSMGVYAHLCLFHKIISDIFAKMQLNLTSHALDLSFKLRDRLWLAGVNLGFHKSL